MVDIGPVQVPAPLCSAAEEQGHVRHRAEQQKENQDQGEGQPAGPGDRREILSGDSGQIQGCGNVGGCSSLTLLFHPQQGHRVVASRDHTGPLKEQTGLVGLRQLQTHVRGAVGTAAMEVAAAAAHLIFQEKPF